MLVRCPTCSTTNDVDDHAADFPARCPRCGGYARKACKEPDAGRPRRDLPREPEKARRIERGELAGLLLARPSREEEVSVIMAGRRGGAAQAGILLPESRKEVARAYARDRALRKATLRGSHEALGALGWVGLGFVVLLFLSALVLKAQAMINHPAPSRPDILRVP